LEGWYLMAHRSPFVKGHCMLGYKGEYQNDAPPPKWRDALEIAWRIVYDWAKKHKCDEPHMAFFRLNLGKPYFRMDLLPFGPEEIQEAWDSLCERVPGEHKKPGGGCWYLGQKEHLGELDTQEFKKLSVGEVRKVLEERGIIEMVEQMRESA